MRLIGLAHLTATVSGPGLSGLSGLSAPSAVSTLKLRTVAGPRDRAGTGFRLQPRPASLRGPGPVTGAGRG